MRPKPWVFLESQEHCAARINTTPDLKTRGQVIKAEMLTEDTLQELSRRKIGVALATNATEIANDSALREVLQELRRRSIDLEMWLTLTPDQGYWINPSAVRHLPRAVGELRHCLAHTDIDQYRLGIDMEMHADLLLSGTTLRDRLRAVWHNLFSSDERSKADDRFTRQVDDLVRAENLGVTLYQIPFLGDWAITRGAMGILKDPLVQHDNLRRVGMGYTSAMRFGPKPNVPAKKLLKQAMKNERTPGIGVIGSQDHYPGRDLGNTRTLTDAEILADLQYIASHRTPAELYFFALTNATRLQQVMTLVDQTFAAPAVPRAPAISL
ncbi:hypothetical protein KA517_00860 [Candidatus Gracilibacteria bacterium]|nr:hypothetical protein [Candidatus Gracilibacteria bacterium]